MNPILMSAKYIKRIKSKFIFIILSLSLCTSLFLLTYQVNNNMLQEVSAEENLTIAAKPLLLGDYMEEESLSKLEKMESVSNVIPKITTYLFVSTDQQKKLPLGVINFQTNDNAKFNQGDFINLSKDTLSNLNLQGNEVGELFGWSEQDKDKYIKLTLIDLERENSGPNYISTSLLEKLKSELKVDYQVKEALIHIKPNTDLDELTKAANNLGLNIESNNKNKVIQTISSSKKLFNIINFLVGILTIFIIIQLTYLIIRFRRKEIGIYKLVGFNNYKIALVLTVEIVIMLAFSAILSILLLIVESNFLSIFLGIEINHFNNKKLLFTNLMYINIFTILVIGAYSLFIIGKSSALEMLKEK